MRDIMIDLETFSTDSNGAIITVSLVEFNIGTGEIGKAIEIGIDTPEQLEGGAVIDQDTVDWWAEQPLEAITLVNNMPKLPVREVLDTLSDFLKDNPYHAKDLRLWGNGSGFDNVMLRNLYKRSGVEFPLPYWCDKDVRTAAFLGKVNPRHIPFVGVKHCGIDDCKHQIKVVTKSYNP